MNYLKIYLGIGCLMSLYFGSYYFLNRKNLAKPISEATLLLRMTFYALLWPFCVKTMFSKDIVDFVSISAPLIPDFKKNYEAQLKRKQELWDSPPLCGQHVFARGVNEAEYIRLSSAFIFDAAQLAAILENNRFSKGDFQSDEAAIARWLSYRDTQLNCITKVPNPWGECLMLLKRRLKREWVRHFVQLVGAAILQAN